MFNFIKWFILVLIIMPMYAEAYIDPGSGSYFFQIILGVVFGLLISFWSVFSKIIRYFRNRFKNKEKEIDVEIHDKERSGERNIK